MLAAATAVDRLPVTERGQTRDGESTHSRRYGRQADLLLDLIHGDRTRRSVRGLHSRLASDSADDSVFAERMLMPGSGYSCR